MIEGNRIKLGYGDISIGFDYMLNSLTIRQFKPPAPEKCGMNVSKDVEFIGDTIYIWFKDLDEYYKFNNLLDRIDKDIYEFEFQGYIFDFSNFNEKSVDVCKKFSSYANILNALAIAC